MEVLSKHAGLWITTNNDVFYSQATHITFICPMRFDSFPLDTQVWPFWLLADPIWQTFCQIFWQTQSYNSGFFWLLSIHTYLIESKIEARCNNAQYFNLIDFFFLLNVYYLHMIFQLIPIQLINAMLSAKLSCDWLRLFGRLVLDFLFEFSLAVFKMNR